MPTTRQSPGIREGRGSAGFVRRRRQAPEHPGVAVCVEGSICSGAARARCHDGQAALPVALLALALLLSVGLVARWGQAALSSSRAQAAADAAALATLVAADGSAIMHGALPDDAAASAAAREAGGELASFELRVGVGTVQVEVIVELDGQRASAAAVAPLPPADAAIGGPAG